MYDALSAEAPGRITLWLARHEGDLVASHDRDPRRHPRLVLLRRQLHREARGPRLQRRAVGDDPRRAGPGAEVYDLRGITDTLDAADSHVGLIQFKVGTGGEAVEYVGEWDLPLNKPLYRAFDLYMKTAFMSRRRP